MDRYSPEGVVADRFDPEAYDRAEREGKRLNDVLCAECPDPALCAAEGECPR